MFGGLLMNGDHVGSGVCKRVDVEFGLFDHEVDVQKRFGCGFADRFCDGGSVADVWDKVAVHDVAVKPGDTAIEAGLDVVLQMEKIGCQEGGG